MYQGEFCLATFSSLSLICFSVDTNTRMPLWKTQKKKIQLRKHTIIIKSSKICFEKILTSIFTVINVIVLRWTFGIIKIHFYVVVNACNFGSIKPHSNSLLNRYPFVIRARNVPERTWMILWFVKLWQILPRLWNYSKYLSGLCNF